MTEKNIVSPCISVCKTDPVSGFCYGCGRSNDDKKLWKDENTSDEWKLNNIEELKIFMSQWMATDPKLLKHLINLNKIAVCL